MSEWKPLTVQEWNALTMEQRDSFWKRLFKEAAALGLVTTKDNVVYMTRGLMDLQREVLLMRANQAVDKIVQQFIDQSL